jgi:hypothetical protein
LQYSLRTLFLLILAAAIAIVPILIALSGTVGLVLGLLLTGLSSI